VASHCRNNNKKSGAAGGNPQHPFEPNQVPPHSEIISLISRTGIGNKVIDMPIATSLGFSGMDLYPE
jgi:hypothetical protein